MKKLAFALVALLLVAGTFGGVVLWRSASGSSPDFIIPTVIQPNHITVNGEQLSDQFVALLQANGYSNPDAIDQAINQIVLAQAARSMGLEATDKQALDYLTNMEAGWSKESDTDRARRLQMLQAQGLATQNITNDPTWLTFGKTAAMAANLINFLHKRLAVAQLTGVSVDSISNAAELASAMSQLDAATLRTTENQIVSSGGGNKELARFTQLQRAKAVIVTPAPSQSSPTAPPSQATVTPQALGVTPAP